MPHQQKFEGSECLQISSLSSMDKKRPKDDGTYTARCSIYLISFNNEQIKDNHPKSSTTSKPKLTNISQMMFSKDCLPLNSLSLRKICSLETNKNY